MKTFVQWALVALAVYLLLAGKIADYVVAGVFVLIAVLLQLGRICDALKDTHALHVRCHAEAMGGVDNLRADFAPPKNPRHHTGVSVPYGPEEGDVWTYVDGTTRVYFKGSWELINPTDAALRINEMAKS